MKRKIISLSIIGMLLLMVFSSLSAVAIINSKENEKQTEEPLPDDFKIRVFGGIFGVHIIITSNGLDRWGNYEVSVDFNRDIWDNTESGEVHCSPSDVGSVVSHIMGIGFGRVTVTVSIGSQTVEKSGIYYGFIGFCILF